MLDASKEKVCEHDHEMTRNALIVGAGGVVSRRAPQTGLIVIKPSGTECAEVIRDGMVLVDP